MKIINKFNEKSQNLGGAQPVTIAFLGDSVTQGCFDVYQTSENSLATVYEAEYAYHTDLRKIVNILYPRVPVNIINAGICGGSAKQGDMRLERDVLRLSPDLCVVCFGLNDSCIDPNDTGAQGVYISSLKSIFEKLQANGVEVIYMTPNMMCTEVSCHIKSDYIRGFAQKSVGVETSGRLEAFLTAGKELAESMNIPVCDCYSKWKKLNEGGVNTTELLSNKINHPTKEMNWMFAYSLVETMFNN